MLRQPAHIFPLSDWWWIQGKAWLQPWLFLQRQETLWYRFRGCWSICLLFLLKDILTLQTRRNCQARPGTIFHLTRLKAWSQVLTCSILLRLRGSRACCKGFSHAFSNPWGHLFRISISNPLCWNPLLERQGRSPFCQSGQEALPGILPCRDLQARVISSSHWWR